MKVSLFDFQEEGIKRLKVKLKNASILGDFNNPQAISFSSPTGSGKTVMMTALFEKILFGDEDTEPNLDRVTLWLSDMPELNEQTKKKIHRMSSKIKTSQLVTIESDFDEQFFEKGKIYFLNTQKLGSDKLLTKKRDGRSFTIWETINNTAKNNPKEFIVVIDEAHRGMQRTEKNHKTIMQKFILGSSEDNLDIIPIVIGISATPKRFEDLLQGTSHTIHKEYINPEDVRDSGLLKERILIHYPDNPTDVEYTLLVEALEKWDEMCDLWDNYSHDETEEIVKPILVVQVQDGDKKSITKTDLSQCISAIENKIGRSLEYGEIVHNFNEVGDITIDNYIIKNVEASKIQDDNNIKVVFFKMSLSTGWDCPRAEVMMSFRKAEDLTYITQLLGRMIRTPLSRRIEKEAALNDVHLFLPNYDKESVEAVINALNNSEDAPPSNVSTSKKGVTLYKNKNLQTVFENMTDLITYQVNKSRYQRAIKRVVALGRRLTFDEVDVTALSEIKEKIINEIISSIDQLKNTEKFNEKIQDLVKVKINTVAIKNTTNQIESNNEAIINATQIDLDKYFNISGRILGNGLNLEYWKSVRTQDNKLADYEIKLNLIAFTRTTEELDRLERKCNELFDEYYQKYRKKISKLKEQSRVIYNQLRTSYSDPQDISWIFPESIDFQVGDTPKEFEKHLYVNSSNQFKVSLDQWEEDVLNMELKSSDVVAWLRNIDRKNWALQIPYESGNTVLPMFPDLLIIREKEDDYYFDILEPHNPSLKDNVEKAIGLAKFAEKHDGLYDRIQLIRKYKGANGEENYYRLDLGKESVRKKVLLINTNSQLDDLFKELATL